MSQHQRTTSVSTRAHGKLLAVAALLASGLMHNGTAYAQARAEWTTPAGVLQGTRYSALKDITAKNVGTLTEEFAYPTGTKASHEGGPLVVGSVMYVVTPFPNKLIALDLTKARQSAVELQPVPER